MNDCDKLCTEIVVCDQMNQLAFHYRVLDSTGEPVAVHARQDLGRASQGLLGGRP